MIDSRATSGRFLRQEQRTNALPLGISEMRQSRQGKRLFCLELSQRGLTGPTPHLAASRSCLMEPSEVGPTEPHARTSSGSRRTWMTRRSSAAISHLGASKARPDACLHLCQFLAEPLHQIFFRLLLLFILLGFGYLLYPSPSSLPLFLLSVTVVLVLCIGTNYHLFMS
jgi:hypothetical protein